MTTSFSLLLILPVFFEAEAAVQNYTGDDYLATYYPEWMLNCKDQDCQCFMFPYIPMQVNISETPATPNPDTLIGTSNILRQNGVRLKSDCEFLSNSYVTDNHVTCQLQSGGMDIDAKKNARSKVNCLALFTALDLELVSRMENGLNTLVFFQPARALKEIQQPYRRRIQLEMPEKRLRMLPVVYDAVGIVEVVLALCLANKLFRINLILDTENPNFSAALQYHAHVNNQERRDIVDDEIRKHLNLTANDSTPFNSANYDLFHLNAPTVIDPFVISGSPDSAKFKEGQSFLRGALEKSKGNASMLDGCRFPGAWFFPYPWYDFTGGVTLTDDFFDFGYVVDFNDTVTERFFPIGFKELETCSYDVGNMTNLVTTNSLMSLIPFIQGTDEQLKSDILSSLSRQFFVYDVTFTDFNESEDINTLFQTVDKSEILPRIIDPVVFPLLRTQILTTLSDRPKDNTTYFDVIGISAVLTGCDIAGFRCLSEVYPLNASDFAKNVFPVNNMSKHPAFTRIADFLNRSHPEAVKVKCQNWCVGDDEVPYVSPSSHFDEECQLCINCPLQYRKHANKNGICVPCKMGMLRRTDVDIFRGECRYVPVHPANIQEGSFDLYWVGAIAIGIFIVLSCVLVGLACLKSFDRYEAIFDVFYDYIVWHWIALFLICSSPLLALLPINSFSCPFNFIYSTLARSSISVIQMTRLVQSWVHIHRQKSIRKADLLAEVRTKVVLTSSEAHRVKSCRVPSLFDSLGFRALFVIICFSAVLLFALCVSHFLVYPYTFLMGCRYLDATLDTTFLACYEAGKIWIYMLSFLPLSVMLVAVILLWKITDVINIPPSEPCMIACAAVIQLLLVVPVVVLMALSRLNVPTFMAMSNCLYLAVASAVWIIAFLWKMALCSPTVAEKYPGWAHAFSQSADDIDRLRYCSCPDPHYKKTLKAVLWENFGRDIESAKGARDMNNVEEDLDGRHSTFRRDSIFRTGGTSRSQTHNQSFSQIGNVGSFVAQQPDQENNTEPEVPPQ